MQAACLVETRDQRHDRMSPAGREPLVPAGWDELGPLAAGGAAIVKAHYGPEEEALGDGSARRRVFHSLEVVATTFVAPGSVSGGHTSHLGPRKWFLLAGRRGL